MGTKQSEDRGKARFISFRDMANISATITGLNIHDQQLWGRVSVVGDAGGFGQTTLVIYDASGAERSRSDLGKMEAGQPWDLQLDVEGGGLEDGDYAAWLWVYLTAADGSSANVVEQGINFLVGRGEVYPSREAVDKPNFESAVEPSNVRLEGSWIVFDMKNTATHDIEVSHSVSIIGDSGIVHRSNEEELVRAGATQQGHYLLPEHIANGRYFVSVIVQAHGSDAAMPTGMNIDVDQGVVTVVT